MTNERIEKLSLIRNIIPIAAIYEQLAEEAAELAQASLKMARIHREENYTPTPYLDAADHLIEEYTDVFLCAQTLGLHHSEKTLEEKLDRWIERNDTEHY